MKFKIAYLLFAAVLFVSCERKLKPPVGGSGSSPAAALIGKWKLISTAGSTISSSELDLFGIKTRTESKITYTSSNPKGFYEITSTDFKAVGLGYDYGGVVNIKIYADNVLQNEVTNPFPAAPIGPYDQSTPYKLVGSDSISFTSATPVFVFQTASGPLVPPSGCKYKIAGKTLTLTMKYSNTNTDNSSGIPIVNKSNVDANYVLEKQ
ncbi:MAG: hypothetical protein K2X48_03610 [Chitinophagaceae bacterium]|nr:hypothetical protein [Chitinophagaceae bacterium]